MIVVADADVGRRAELSRWLQEDGFHVTEAQSVGEVLTSLATAAPALIVLGTTLVDGDGFALCKRIKKTNRSRYPAVLMVVPCDNGASDRADQANADDTIVEPVHRASLLRRARLLIELYRQRQAQDADIGYQIFHQSRAAMLLVDAHTSRIIDANRAACQFYGYSCDQLLDKAITDLEVHSESDEPLVKTTNLIMRHRLADGSLRAVAIFPGPIAVNGSRRVCLIIHDITKRQMAEAEERRQRILADALRETAADLVSTFDLDEVLDRILTSIQRIIDCDGASIMLIEDGMTRTLRLVGYGDDEGRSYSVRDVRFPIETTFTIGTVYATKCPQIISDVRSEAEWQTLEHLEWVRSHMTVPICLNEQVIGFLNVDSPVVSAYSQRDADRLQAFADQAAVAIRNAETYQALEAQAARLEQRVAERTADLERERAQLDAILDAMSEGVIYGEVTEVGWRVLFVNSALMRMTDFDEEEWLSDDPTVFRDEDESGQSFRDRVLKPMIEAVKKDGQWHTETYVLRRDGTRFLAHIDCTALTRSDGKLYGAVGVIRDISRERELEQNKSRFVAHASHELRTPLTNAKTRLYLIRRQPERIDDHLRVLEDVIDQMRRLVEDLLDYSRFERGKIVLRWQQVDLGALIAKIVRIQAIEAEKKAISLTCALPDEPLFELVDPERLGQVLTNLIVNAINYTPPGGSIEVRLYPIGQVTDGHWRTAIEVEDSGIGIPPDALETIFQPFYRIPSKVQGTGLGLSIAREIVHLHGGVITVASRLNEGSRFTIWLGPLQPEPGSRLETEQ